jgi:phosphonate transport system permease protein
VSTEKKRDKGFFGRRPALWVTVLILLLYIVPSVHLKIGPKEFLNGENWRQMADLVIRLGPFERINTCKNAEIVWGTADPEGPWSGTLDPEKVAAVCERGEMQYWYRSDYLADQLAYVKEVRLPLLDTFRMAIIGTFIGSLLAVPAALYSSQNLVRKRWVYLTARTVMNLIRTVPDLALAAILVGAFGTGALSGIMALSIFSFAIIAKLLSESIESIDPGPLEAIQATGGSWLQQIAYGVWPQILPNYMGYVLYVLEVNVRSSTVLGYVGAGGIGQELQTNLTLGKFREVGVVILVMLVIVVAMDGVSNKLRERLV